jgi:hypothetical protein
MRYFHAQAMTMVFYWSKYLSDDIVAKLQLCTHTSLSARVPHPACEQKRERYLCLLLLFWAVGKDLAIVRAAASNSRPIKGNFHPRRRKEIADNSAVSELLKMAVDGFTPHLFLAMHVKYSSARRRLPRLLEEEEEEESQ